MGTWHPILATVEHEPGVFTLTGHSGPYALVRLLRVGDELGYRATTYTEPRQLVGYFTNLRAACAAAHAAYVRAHGPTLDPATIYPNLSGQSEHRSAAAANASSSASVVTGTSAGNPARAKQSS